MDAKINDYTVLIDGFYSLGNNVDPKILAHSDDSADNGLTFMAVIDAAY